MEEVQITKTASINRNDNNEIIVDQEGYITCQTDSMYFFKCLFICVVCLFICVLLITVDYRWINF